jgi:Mg2+ and Co2+ transporter CorA
LPAALMTAVERNTSREDLAEALITARSWEPGLAPVVVDLSDASLDSGVLHLDVDFTADPRLVYDALRPICGPDLTLEMVEDLLAPDELPKVETMDDEGRIRAVSAFAATAVKPSRDSRTKSGRLCFELVEFLANDHWLITCYHQAESYAGGGVSQAVAGQTCAILLQSASRRWVDGSFDTAGDLGIVLLHELTCSYSDASRELTTWLDAWERQFYDNPKVEQETLRDLRGLVSEFRARLNALNVPRDEAGSAWFGGVTEVGTAERADSNVDRALSTLDRLSDMLRSSFGLIQANATARQLKIAQDHQDDSEKLQRKIEIVTGAFLVPTLIAGTWGENTWVPGQGQPWGFALTLVTMFVGGLLATLWLRARRKVREARA